ncbi:hypothetical protein SteCoe_31415 [Stentor coeruleus]|uniref:Uncharacterized protein n=1 Tax=Stentor coeruleus TaxID=5963 RepID=A0A1R2B1E6_9CILI|nr:hypothetical protein SteCoe_31415 [Stentor coeruleus]
MDSTEENKQQIIDLKAYYKANRKAVRCYCLCLMPVFIYAWIMSLMTLISGNAFTQIFTNGETDYEFKGSIKGPTNDTFINFTNYSYSKTNLSFDLNERLFEVSCHSNQSYDECFDNCKGHCEFFKDWSDAGSIFLIGIIPSLASNIFIFFMMICAYITAWTWCITISLVFFTLPPILYIITFTIWAIKMDLHENDVYHNVFTSTTAPVKRESGLNVVIVFIVTMPFYLAFFYCITKNIKILFKKGIWFKKSAITSSMPILQYYHQPELNNMENNEETKQNLNYINITETRTEHLLEDYASPERINISAPASFDESLER